MQKCHIIGYARVSTTTQNLDREKKITSSKATIMLELTIWIFYRKLNILFQYIFHSNFKSFYIVFFSNFTHNINPIISVWDFAY